ncbi:MAG: DUF2235 domain-containing protein [Pseudomonadota bacterium]
MAKNIVILFDGTSNEISADRTNILRLYGTLKKSEDQIVWYDPGVGTIGLAWLGIWRKFMEIFGLATGYGLDKNVKEAYRFLVETYQRDEDGTRDRIFIFGFSRGAYSARVLAGFIHAFGLMEKRNLNLLDYVYRGYKRIGEGGKENAFAEMRLFERTLRADRPPIRMLGLFDTVASVIETGRFGLRLRSNAHTSTNSSVQSVRHAVAIDERRTMFDPMLWPETQDYSENRFDTSKSEPQDAKEVWFRGVHGDVGGGYPEEASALAKIPLAWMISEAKETELQFITRTVNDLVLGRAAKYVAPNPHANHHDSMGFGWSILELLPRRHRSHSKRPKLLGMSIPFMERRWIPEGARIHSSVEQTGHRPPNLPDGVEFVD